MTAKLEIAKGGRAAEIFQSLDIKFAFVTKIEDNVYKQLHLAIKCRDFLGDCIWSGKTNKIASIYSFQFDANKTPLDTDKLRLSLKFPDKKSMRYFIDNFDLIDTLEGLAETTVASLIEADQPLTIIIEADKLWQSAVWKISLYTFYLKMISYKNETQLQEPENEYRVFLNPEIERKLLSKVSFMEEILAQDIDSAHNYSGFVSIIKGINNKPMTKLLLGDNK